MKSTRFACMGTFKGSTQISPETYHYFHQCIFPFARHCKKKTAAAKVEVMALYGNPRQLRPTKRDYKNAVCDCVMFDD